jgi:hypothetical protein
MQRAIWLIPAQWFAWWAAFQCIAICVSLIALQAVGHALTARVISRSVHHC